MGVVSTIVGLHLWFLASEVRTKGMEGRSGVRAFLSAKRQRGWTNVVWNVIYLLAVLASIGILAADAAECVRADADFSK
eukprot:3940017-Rhodomonas_salina.1